jgi:hypothetical protein
MKNPIPAALLTATLARRGTVDPDALLDCLSLVAVLDARSTDLPRSLVLIDRLITLKELRQAWCCTGWEAIQRMNALQATQLVDCTYSHDGAVWWRLHRVGPVA